MLETNGYLVYTVVGMSMQPLLKQRRDIVDIRAKGAERFHRYDVVLYKSDGRYVLHRILKVRPDDYVIAGDHNTFLEYIRDDQILGVMTRIIRDGKERSLNSWKYKAYVHLWCDFYPVRMAILRVKGLARRVKRRLKKMTKK